jgi:hypothetical protein
MFMQKISILIPSCDKYFDLWPILSESYLKFRNDCPFKIFIITNSEIKVPKPFFALNIGEDISRSDNCIKALSIINSKYILMHIDDLILNKKVNTEKILNRINL